MTTVLTTQDVARIVQRVGLPDLLRRLVSYLESDYLRWAEFDKTPRVAAHSPDGVIELKAHYLLQADDGTKIYIQNLGYLVRAQPGSSQPSYFRVTPYFRVPKGPHDWLSRTVVVGGGERRSNPDRTLFRYYALV